jgi:lysozyme
MNKPLLIVGLASAAAWLLLRRSGPNQYGEEETILDGIETQMDITLAGLGEPGPVQYMSTSPAMLDMLKRRERLMLGPYNLGDGGWTIGYGHFEKNRDDLPAISSEADAETLFASDVQERAEKWVKLYVKVDLTQNQFDALVSIAYNMSPKSFKKFANAVNAGEGIDAIASQSVAWVDPKFTNGIQNRRDEEIAVFNYGIYA